MDCKWLEAELLTNKSYTIEKRYKKYLINKLQWRYQVEKEKNSKYIIEWNQNKYGVCYCVRYRPIGVLEWILARGWWNDKWIWTEDWIFNDWIL